MSQTGRCAERRLKTGGFCNSGGKNKTGIQGENLTRVSWLLCSWTLIFLIIPLERRNVTDHFTLTFTATGSFDAPIKTRAPKDGA